MSKVKEILRLKFDVGLSLRDIAASCNCGKSTVEDVLKRAQAAKIPWPCDLNDKELLSLIYPPAEARKTTAEPDLNYIFSEMKRKHVTLMLLWEEYKRDNPDGRPFQKLEGNRRTAFEAIDKPALKPLPTARYEYADWANAKISFNYHVEYRGFFYSVPYSNIGRISRIRATASVIEIFVDGVRIAAHKRNFNTYKRYSTLPEHMPESHKVVTEWSSERYLSWAEKIGPKTRHLVSNILDSNEYPVQTYRACMGIMRLASDYSAETVEAASKEAIDKRTCTYKYFSIILRQKALKESSENEKVVSNANLRGAKSYVGGGMNA